VLLRKFTIAVLLFIYLLIPKGSFSGTIKGYVYELETGTPLVNATVHLEKTNLYAVSGLNGSFVLENVPSGSYTLVVNYVSLKTFKQAIKIKEKEVFSIEAQLEQDENSYIEEVVVTGKSEETSERAARSIEQSVPQIMNVVSSQAIKISPDLTVANIVKRVSGVTIEQDNAGNGQYAILRGMDKRYNYTLVNGIKIPSPDRDNRYVPLDIFPSELLERLEVYKTLTPAMEGDAIGGAVNMVMKDAPSNLQINFNIATGYNDIYFTRDFMSFNHNEINKLSPYQIHPKPYSAVVSDFSMGPVSYQLNVPLPDILAGFTAANRFFNKKLGVLLAANLQNSYRGTNSLFFESSVVDTLKGVTLTSMQDRAYSEQELRYAFHSKIDYRLPNRNKIQWNNSFMNLTNFQVRDSKLTYLALGGYDPVNGNAALLYSTRSRTTKQNIFNSTLQGDHHLSPNLKLDWSAVYSIAKNDVPDNAKVTLNGEQNNFVARKTTAKNESRRWEYNTDRDLAAYLNLTYYLPVATIPIEWTVGGLYRHKRRDNFFNEYYFRPADPYTEYGKDFDNYDEIQWIVENPRGSVGTSLNYEASEKIAAEFVQFKSSGKRMEVIGGLRVETTNQGYELDFPIGEKRPNGKQVYTDFLPGLHLKYMPDAKINVRASYFRSINRPGFFEIVPYTIVNEDYVERGNPDLKHAVADNIDFRFEAFPRPAEQFMVGLFYKHIQNPIEYILKADNLRGQDIYYSPGNFGNAANYGSEIDFIKYFNKVGFKANYTYAHSSITTAKSKRIRDENGDLKTISVDETRSLYGQSAHVGNLSVLYKDGRRGWDAQLALQYTGDRISSVSQFVGNDIWQKALVQMDASVEKRFKNRLGIFAKANNLLNSPMTMYINNTSPKNADVPEQTLSGKTLIRQNYFQRSYYLGLRYEW
jgi:hypothetical protein